MATILYFLEGNVLSAEVAALSVIFFGGKHSFSHIFGGKCPVGRKGPPLSQLFGGKHTFSHLFGGKRPFCDFFGGNGQSAEAAALLPH